MRFWGQALAQRPWLGLHVRTLLLLVLLSIIFLAHLFDFTDPDVFFHLRTGQFIWETRSIPTQDPFSYTAGDRAWITHEWLSQVAMYLTDQAFTYGGLVVFFAALTTGAFYLQHRLLVRLGVHEVLAVVLVFWSASVLFPFFTVRPVTFTWLFLVIYLLILYRYHRTERAPLWALPILMVLWVNLHGGFIMGLMLVGLLLGVRVVERPLLKRTAPLRPLAVTLALTAAATLANPNLSAGLAYPLTYLGSDNASLEIIAEWQSPDFHETYLMLFFAGALVLGLALGAWRRRLGLWPLAVIALFTVLALQSTRQIPLFALAAFPVMGEVLTDRFAFARARPRTPQPAALLAVNWGILLILWGLAIPGAARIPNYHVQPEPLPTRGIEYPQEAASYILERYPQARIFNVYHWGGYLLYRFYPQQRVFIDGRADLYGYRLVKDYVEIAKLHPRWRALLDQYHIELVLFEQESPMAEALGLDSNWEEVYRDTVAVVFVRSARSAP